MAESSNRFIALDKPIKKYIQEQQSKKTPAKTRRDVKVNSLSEFLKQKEEERKVLKKANTP